MGFFKDDSSISIFLLEMNGKNEVGYFDIGTGVEIVWRRVWMGARKEITLEGWNKNWVSAGQPGRTNIYLSALKRVSHALQQALHESFITSKEGLILTLLVERLMIRECGYPIKTQEVLGNASPPP